MRLSVPAALIGSLGALVQAAIGGLNALVTTSRGFTYGASFSSAAQLAAGATEQVFAAASNVNGAIIWDAAANTQGNAAGTSNLITLNANTVAPVAATSGDVLFALYASLQTTVADVGKQAQIAGPVVIAAGKGLWFRNTSATIEGGAPLRRVLYTLL